MKLLNLRPFTVQTDRLMTVGQRHLRDDQLHVLLGHCQKDCQSVVHDSRYWRRPAVGGEL